MANTTKTLERIEHVKNLTENILLDKKLPEKMGPILFPMMKDQLLENIKDLKTIQFQVEMLHYGSRFLETFPFNNHEIFTLQERINSLAKRNQTLDKITDVLQSMTSPTTPTKHPK